MMTSILVPPAPRTGTLDRHGKIGKMENFNFYFIRLSRGSNSTGRTIVTIV